MKHLKSFFVFESGPAMDFEEHLDRDLPDPYMKDIPEYYKAIIDGIILRMKIELGDISPIVTGKGYKNLYNYILDCIDGHQNENGEYEPNYPQVKRTVAELWEDECTVTEAINELLDACLEIYYGHASAL